MRYIKPQILAASSATSTIQGGKVFSPEPDNHHQLDLMTVPAYQADE